MNNTTTELQWGDVIFKPGQRVRTTDASDYAGLDGVILEIHTGEDKETDNLTPDIHCCFDFPESEADIRKLEERFSSLYNMPKKLDDLALDEVIMSPDELISIPEEPSRLLHYIGTDEWARPVYQDQYGKLWKDVELGDFEIPHLHSAVGNEFDGEPDMPIRKPFRILTDKPKNPYEFQYMMLSRLQSDCDSECQRQIDNRNGDQDCQDTAFDGITDFKHSAHKGPFFYKIARDEDRMLFFSIVHGCTSFGSSMEGVSGTSVTGAAFSEFTEVSS